MEMRLNKYIAHCGLASRRKADLLILSGFIAINDQSITELGYKVQKNDKVTFRGKLLKPQKKLLYILLNKPKDCITTTQDEKGRKTVMDYVKRFKDERIYPIGRLDRNTTGLLLLTNDGEFAQKLSHPSQNIAKIYTVHLHKPLTKNDFDSISKGIILEDGKAEIDEIHYYDIDKSLVSVQIHSGKNRIVRRVFEHLGYTVLKLDRVIYAELTKKNLPRGKWRELEFFELEKLKKISASERIKK